MKTHIHNTILSPIIKWAGGKEKEIKYIIPNIPPHFENYYEPFVGGGSVYTSFNVEKLFINDKSAELIALYTNISQSNSDFYQWSSHIIEAWNKMLIFANEQKELKEIYEQYRDDLLSEQEVKTLIEQHLIRENDNINQVLPISFSWHRTTYNDEVKKNLIRKIIRMKKIEQERHRMPQQDIYDNIETAFMSALYMYFRQLYNDTSLLMKEEKLASALFLFIRNYAYSGMFRYNDKGEFNVPYGGMGYNKKSLEKKIHYYQSEELLQHLSKTEISNLDFEDFFRKYAPTEKDFVFLDPPYDTEFSSYAQNDFTQEDQRRLARYLCTECPAKWMLIIKNTPFILSLYENRNLNIKTFDKQYLVSFMNRNDKKAEHLLITNY